MYAMHSTSDETSRRTPLTRRELVIVAVGCALVAALFLGRAIAPGRALSPADLLFSFYPWRAEVPANWSGASNPLLSDSVLAFEPWLAYSAQRLRAGALPLWNPDNMLGAPLIGNMQSGVFYPINWVYFLLPGPGAFALMAWLKLWLCGLGTYLLARRVAGVGPGAAAVAALTFGLGSFMTVWLLYPLASTALWLPWLWLATARLLENPGPQRCALLAGIVALSILAGHPETALHLAIATGVFALYCAWRLVRQGEHGKLRLALRPLGWWGAAYVLGAAVAAVQVLPFIEYVLHSAVLIGRSNLGAASISVPAYYAWTLFSPDLFGNPAHRDWWGPILNYNEVNTYVGLVPLALAPLALLARRRGQRTLAALLVAIAFLSLGVVYDWPLLHGALQGALDFVPLVGIGANQRLLLLAQFALALLAALGLDAVISRLNDKNRTLPFALAATVLSLLLVGVGGPALFGTRFLPSLLESITASATWQAGIAHVVLLSILTFAILITALLLRNVRPKISYAALAMLPLLLGVDLWLARSDYNPSLPIGDYFPSTSASDYLKSQPGPFRVVGANFTFLQNSNLVYGLADLRGYDAIAPQTYHDLARQIDPAIPEAAGGGLHPFSTVESPLLNLLNVRFLLLPPGDPAGYVVGASQEKNGGLTVGKIAGENRPGQTFVAQHDYLAEVQVFGGTYNQREGLLQFHLSTAPGRPDLVTTKLEVSSLKDNSYWPISFPPIQHSRGQSFYFYFSAPDANEETGVSLWYRANNLYTEGNRTQNGRPVEGDLVFRTLSRHGPDDPDLASVLDGGDTETTILENRKALPRAWLVHEVEVRLSPDELLARLGDPDFNPSQTALVSQPLSEGIDDLAPSAATTDAVTVTRYLAEEVGIATRSLAPGLLILADQDFPGWNAQVDGQPTTTLRADHALRAVHVPTGEHTVQFRYLPTSFVAGATITGAALLLMLLLAIWGRITVWLRRRQEARTNLPGD
jgi:hypothetical protein